MDVDELSKLQSLASLNPIHKIEQTVQEIRDILNLWSICVASEELTLKENGSYKFEIVFKLADFLEDFIFVGRMVYYLRGNPYKVTFDTLLVHSDFTPVCIKNPNTKFLARRHILKLNSLLRYGSFSVDDIGIIKFHLLWNYETNADLAMRTREDIEKWMKISFATTMSTLKVNMVKLITMTEIIDQETYNCVVKAQGALIRQLPKFFYDDQDKLKNMILDGVRLKTSGKNLEKEKIRVDSLPDYPYPFYQRVKVVNVAYHGRLTVGGYAAIHVVKARMELEELGKQAYKDKYFLVKVPKQPPGVRKQDNEYVLDIAKGVYRDQDTRINIERKVLNYPTEKNFQHIARYYDDWTDEYQRPILYMENYMPQNLHEFNARKELGMGTKLSWLYQLAHVLVYFKKNHIIHIDLKPSNIVVAKNFFLKVIDFAESILKGVKDFKNEKRATTMPFSSPESLDDYQSHITYESDVFSFAHIAYELIGQKLMIGFKRSSEAKVRQRYKKKNFKLLPISNWLNYQGPVYLMQYLYYIIMLCSIPDPSCRFPQEILVNFIKEFALFSEKLY